MAFKSIQRRRTYQCYQDMKQRCANHNNPSYKNYGGRGITVCDEWAVSFDLFVSEMGEKPDGMSLDRIENEEGYSAANCRWADNTTQSRNTRITQRDDVGVSYDRRDRRWNAHITVANKGFHIGAYASKDEAISARAAAEKHYWENNAPLPVNGNIQRNNTSGFIGVSLNKKRGKWEAYAYVGRKRANLGYYESAAEAATVRATFDQCNRHHGIGGIKGAGGGS